MSERGAAFTLSCSGTAAGTGTVEIERVFPGDRVELPDGTPARVKACFRRTRTLWCVADGRGALYRESEIRS